jgi:hypothetical protein
MPTTGEIRVIRFTTIAILIMVFFSGLSTTDGQAVSDSSTRARVGFLVGNFAIATYIPPTPKMQKGVTGKGASVITWALDSMFLAIEDESVNPLFGRYKAHGMLGFESQTHQFVLSMFNNFGDHPVYHGNFVGDTLVLQTKIPAPKGSFDQQLRWYKDGEAVKLKILNDSGKGFLLILEQTATPVSQKTN